MMAYDYIRRVYGVGFNPGERIAVDGKPGTVTKPRDDLHYVRVRFDGQKHISNAHPTWRITRLAAL